jgi:hypothetical protein
MKPWAPECWYFRSCIPTVYILAYLRIADTVTRVGARLTTDLRDYALAGQVSHLLGG